MTMLSTLNPFQLWRQTRWIRWIGYSLLALLTLELCARGEDLARQGAPFWQPFSIESVFQHGEFGREGRDEAARSAGGGAGGERRFERGGGFAQGFGTQAGGRSAQGMGESFRVGGSAGGQRGIDARGAVGLGGDEAAQQ